MNSATSALLEGMLSDSKSISNCLYSLIGNGNDLELSMRHALHGGKNVRGFLVMESARIHGISPLLSVMPAAGIEAMHAYSLVHDDLPCMDDDDMRRGQPTVHVKWNEHTAILAGDALLSLAFRLVCDPSCKLSSDIRAELAFRLAVAGGHGKLILGQALDIEAENSDLTHDLEAIRNLQSHKTGALIEWSATAGAIMGGADENAMSSYAKSLGLAFQIQDDVIDVTGSSSVAGKTVGKDEKAGKATFVSLLGLEGAKREAQSLVQNACDALSVYGRKAELLKELANFVISREF